MIGGDVQIVEVMARVLNVGPFDHFKAQRVEYLEQAVHGSRERMAPAQRGPRFRRQGFGDVERRARPDRSLARARLSAAEGFFQLVLDLVAALAGQRLDVRRRFAELPEEFFRRPLVPRT